MIIPLIESTRKRKDIGEKVPLRLLNNDLKIVSGALKIKLYQEQPISDTFKPIEINIGLAITDDLVSSEKSHQFDISQKLQVIESKNLF